MKWNSSTADFPSPGQEREKALTMLAVQTAHEALIGDDCQHPVTLAAPQVQHQVLFFADLPQPHKVCLPMSPNILIWQFKEKQPWEETLKKSISTPASTTTVGNRSRHFTKLFSAAGMEKARQQAHEVRLNKMLLKT